jgi:hypothetical protein
MLNLVCGLLHGKVLKWSQVLRAVFIWQWCVVGLEKREALKVSH